VRAQTLGPPSHEDARLRVAKVRSDSIGVSVHRVLAVGKPRV
jgi:hypothetical protein